MAFCSTFFYWSRIWQKRNTNTTHVVFFESVVLRLPPAWRQDALTSLNEPNFSTLKTSLPDNCALTQHRVLLWPACRRSTACVGRAGQCTPTASAPASAVSPLTPETCASLPALAAPTRRSAGRRVQRDVSRLPPQPRSAPTPAVAGDSSQSAESSLAPLSLTVACLPNISAFIFLLFEN